MRQVVFQLLVVLCLGSCSDILEVPDISSKQVEILAPVDQVTLTSGPISFTWEQVIDAQYYHLQIAEPSFVQAQQVVVDTLVESLNFNTNLDEGSYQWRIRGENSAYHTPYNTNSFNVE